MQHLGLLIYCIISIISFLFIELKAFKKETLRPIHYALCLFAPIILPIMILVVLFGSIRDALNKLP